MDIEILIRFLLAALWGGIVGAEREFRGKSAGFRTMIMISIGSCFFTIISMQIGLPSSADRIASNIVTGIGFLGAGVIFRSENKVNGITTAATIWGVAAVGMGIGAGFYYAAAACSILILVVLAILPRFEIFIDKINQSRTYTVKGLYSTEMIDRIELLLNKHKLRYKKTRFAKRAAEFSASWEVEGHSKNHKLFLEDIAAEKDLRDFDY